MANTAREQMKENNTANIDQSLSDRATKGINMLYNNLTKVVTSISDANDLENATVKEIAIKVSSDIKNIGKI